MFLFMLPTFTRLRLGAERQDCTCLYSLLIVSRIAAIGV